MVSAAPPSAEKLGTISMLPLLQAMQFSVDYSFGLLPKKWWSESSASLNGAVRKSAEPTKR